MFGKFFGGSKDKKTSTSSSKTSAKSSPGKKKNDDLAAFGIDPSLLEDPLEDDDAAMDDADMDVDVESIMNEINAPKKQPAKGATKSAKQAQPTANITIDLNSLPKEDEEPEVEVTDADMQDPSLLSELVGLGVDVENDPELAAVLNQGAAVPEEEEDFVLDEEDMKDPALLKEFKSLGGTWTDPKEKKRRQQVKLLEVRIKEFKDAALKCKKENNIEQAKEYLRTFKSLEETLQSVQKGAVIDESKIPPAPKLTAPKPATETKPVQEAKPTPETKPTASKETESKQPTQPQPAKAMQPTPQAKSEQATQPKEQPAPQQIKPQPTVQAKPETTPQTPAKASQPAVAAPAKATVTPTKTEAPSQTTQVPAKPAPQPAQTPTKAAAQPVPSKAEPSKPADNTAAIIEARISEYKGAALAKKKAGDIERAKEFMLGLKKCQALQEKHQRGEHVDVSQLPPSLSKAASTPAKQTQAAPVKTPSSAPTPTKTAAQPASKQTPNVAAPKDKDLEQEDPDPVENMISNDVLEWALQNVNAQIAKLKGKSVPEELSDRKQAIEMQLQILNVKVSTGQLDQDQYLENLRSKIEQERQSVKKYVREGKRDWAALALKRAKIMEEEIKATLEQ